VTTPNLREAAVLTGIDVRDVRTLADMVTLAHGVLAFGSQYVVLKGGHFDEASERASEAPDLLVGGPHDIVLPATRVTTVNDHGTGCSLAAAIAAGLGLGKDVETAVRDAKDFVLRALRGGASWRLGAGHGPIDHMGWNQ
jgi:hydroxymethylpyrimidine kinase/phosphomethylpyrimidine kinase